MKRAIIAAPFGVYLKTNWATSVRGTYTIRPRPGRYTQSLKTFRPIKGGWVNRMGFRNPGISSELGRLQKAGLGIEKDVIWSIGAVEHSSEWEDLYNVFPSANLILELNVGCPNVKGGSLSKEILEQYVQTFDKIILKVPGNAESASQWIETGIAAGVRAFHFCNTIQTDRGGESSRCIQDISIPLIKQIKSEMGSEITCIGGGGIYTADDALKYADVGADHISIATAFLTPWKIPGIKKAIYQYYKGN